MPFQANNQSIFKSTNKNRRCLLFFVNPFFIFRYETKNIQKSKLEQLKDREEKKNEKESPFKPVINDNGVLTYLF